MGTLAEDCLSKPFQLGCIDLACQFRFLAWFNGKCPCVLAILIPPVADTLPDDLVVNHTLIVEPRAEHGLLRVEAWLRSQFRFLALRHPLTRSTSILKHQPRLVSSHDIVEEGLLLVTLKVRSEDA